MSESEMFAEIERLRAELEQYKKDNEKTAQAALDMGFDTSCCYDHDDVLSLIKNKVENLRYDHAEALAAKELELDEAKEFAGWLMVNKPESASGIKAKKWLERVGKSNE